MWGVLITLIASISFTSLVIKTIINLLNGKNEFHIRKILVSLFIVIIGLFISINYFMNLNYDYKVDTSKLEKEEFTYSITLDENVDSDDLLDINVSNFDSNEDLIIDDELEDDVVKVVITYYEDYLKEDNFVYYTWYSADNSQNLNIYYDGNYELKIYKDMILELRNDNVISNYNELTGYEIKVYVNSSTYEKI